MDEEKHVSFEKIDKHWRKLTKSKNLFFLLNCTKINQSITITIISENFHSTLKFEYSKNTIMSLSPLS